MTPKVVLARALGPFVAPRERPIGRIGGSTFALGPEVRAALAASLGPRASVLERGEDRGEGAALELVADFDACWCGARALREPADFRPHLSPDGLAGLDGAFALAWIDDAGALCLARDAIGERSLFFAQTREGVVFASTVRALLATGLIPRVLDPVGVAQYLACAYVPSGRTLVAGIEAVMPGEIVRFARSGEVARAPYWQPLPETEMGTIDDADALRVDLRARLEAAIRRRLSSGEPIGASLSGGLDSSLVVALIRHLSDAPLQTFSISFGPQHPNELQWSSLVAAHCGTDHTILEIPPEAIVAHMDDASAAFDRPVGDPLSVPNALLFRHVAEHVGVLFNGEGGDPCFGGPKNLPMVLAELYGDANNAPGDPFRRERTYFRSHQRVYDELGALLTPDARAAIADDVLERELAPLFRDPRWGTFVNKLMMINLILKGGHHILPKVDALSGTFGVRPRSPLFDRHVVDAAFRIPPQLKLRGAVEKWLLKQAVADVVPQAILDRPKAGMGVPVEAWFYGPLRSYARERLIDGLPKFGIFERDMLERLLNTKKATGLRERRGSKIWLLITLEAWLRRVLVTPDP